MRTDNWGMDTKLRLMTRPFAGVFEMGTSARWLGGAELVFPSAVLAPATATAARHAGLERSPGRYWLAARPAGDKGLFFCAPFKELCVGQAPGANGAGHLAVGLDLGGWKPPTGSAGWPAPFKDRVCTAETAAEIDEWFQALADPDDAWRTAAARAVEKASRSGAAQRNVPSWATSPRKQVERLSISWPVGVDLPWP